MLIVALIRSYKLAPLQEAITELNKEKPPDRQWAVRELQRFDISGIPCSRIALTCDELPPEGMFEIPIEAVIEDKKFCPVCVGEGFFKPLPIHNKSGYCSRHAEKNPVRMEKKRSPKKKGFKA